MKRFDSLKQLPLDPILGLPILFNADSRPHKVNLGIGAYKDAEGKPLVLTSVRDAENHIADEHTNKEYQPIDGSPFFLKPVTELVFGSHSTAVAEERVFACQALGGTGALRLGGELLKRLDCQKIYISDPSWPNHSLIFSQAGLSIETYPYYDMKTQTITFQAFCDFLKGLSAGSVVLLQACCHNPTGMDLTFDQWKILADIFKEKDLIPFFDFAYQGFATGVDADATAIRYFTEQGLECLVASSFSKNFGLYGERVGALFVVTASADSAKRTGSHLKQIIRAQFSNPPLHGARIVSAILSDNSLKKDWIDELDNMRIRIEEMRHAFEAGLLTKRSTTDFSFIKKQKGLFSFCGLKEDQVKKLREEFAIYMPDNGRINVAGLNMHNMDYVINAIGAV